MEWLLYPVSTRLYIYEGIHESQIGAWWFLIVASVINAENSMT